MSNHYHIVVRINAEEANKWSDEEVARRWMQIFSGPLLLQRYVKDGGLTSSELKYVDKTLKIWRERLTNLSWFMRCINEPMARLANREDSCTGRFWEGRFKSQALLDVRALLACMAYVDLNPIRAGISNTPEQSDYTSIQERVKYPDSPGLRRFDDSEEGCIPFNLKDYLELVDWGGREIKHDKMGYIPANTPPILTRLRMDATPLVDYLSKSEKLSFGALGPVNKLRVFAKSVGRCFINGHVLGDKLCPERVMR